jgi:2-oxoisovalerate dehydrogenase E1 component
MATKATVTKSSPKVASKPVAKPSNGLALKNGTNGTSVKTNGTAAKNAKSALKQVKMNYGGKEVLVDLFCEFNFKGFDKETIIKWYKLQHLGRRLDEKAALYLKMAKGWSYHAPFAGHDGIQLALGQVFRASKDYLFPYYRDFLTSLSAGLTPEEIILNGLSKDTDVAGGGRHMSNHFAKPSINVQNVSSCTGNHSQHAAGLARAVKYYNGDEIVYYSGGDSACAEGYFYEAVAAANLDKSPVIFVIQNNKFGISVPLEQVSANLNVADNFVGFKNLKIINCDGRDPFASYNAMQEAIKYVRSGEGPAMVHAECDRIGSHSNSDKQDNYRPDEELQAVYRRDPLLQFRYHILNNKILTEKQLEQIEEENKALIFEAADKAEAAPNANGASWAEFLYPEEFAPRDGSTEVSIPSGAEQLTYLEGINYALKQEFRKNPNTFMWGQDIGKGGVFNVVKGMPQEFGNKRVFNAAIAEDMIVGTANGFSRYRDDIRLIIEGAEFADYFWPAMEQYVELAHEYWRTRGQNTPNVTLRLASGGYIQGGLYHSQNLESALATVPGVRIVQPAFADDAIGLMRNCIYSKGPTMFLEPKYLYNFKPAMGPTPPDNFVVPFGKAKKRREGDNITIVTYGTAVHLSNFAAEEIQKEHGITTEIIDLRSIIPWDKEMVINAVKRTNRVIVVHEDRVLGGFGGEVASVINQEAFGYLDAPVLRVGSKDVHVGFAKEYEKEILLNINDVKQAILKTVNY